MRAAGEEVCGDYIEVTPSDTRNLMGFYVSLRKLLVEVRRTILGSLRNLIMVACAVWH